MGGGSSNPVEGDAIDDVNECESEVVVHPKHTSAHVVNSQPLTLNDTSVFLRNPSDPTYRPWRDSFPVAAIKAKSEQILRSHPELASFERRLVPDLVSEDDFWCRYFFALTQAHELQGDRVAMSGHSEEFREKNSSKTTSWGFGLGDFFSPTSTKQAFTVDLTTMNVVPMWHLVVSVTRGVNLPAGSWVRISVPGHAPQDTGTGREAGIAVTGQDQSPDSLHFIQAVTFVCSEDARP